MATTDPGRTVAPTPDVDAIRAIIADVEAGLNTNDAQLMTVHFAENATAVGVNGVLLSGRQKIMDAHVRGVAGFLRDQYARYDVLDVTFVRPDVALAHKHAYQADATGVRVAPSPAMIALYVLVREGDRWWVIARQNTLIPS